MIFPRGFSGFFDPEDGLMPAVDIGAFKTTCFAVARELGGKVLEFAFAKVTPNFHQATLEWAHGSRTVAVLCNRHYWIVGFCKPPTACSLEYVDAPELAGILRRLADWQLLSKVELETVIDEAALASMNSTDRRIIKTMGRAGGFTPARTVGDVLFNYWD